MFEFFAFIGILASIVGVFFAIQKAVRAIKANRKFKKLLLERPELKGELITIYRKAIKEDSYMLLGEVVDKLRELSLQLPKQTDRNAMQDILENNTRQGTINYISDLLL